MRASHPGTLGKSTRPMGHPRGDSRSGQLVPRFGGKFQKTHVKDPCACRKSNSCILVVQAPENRAACDAAN